MRRSLPISEGCVVKSLRGRDGGRRLIVLRLIDEAFAYVADGDLRKVDKPKRKRRTHLKFEGDPIPELARRLAGGERVGDHELRAALEAYGTEEESTIGKS